MKLTCEICPHHCNLDKGQTDIYNSRTNLDDKITFFNCDNKSKNSNNITLREIEIKDGNIYSLEV